MFDSLSSRFSTVFSSLRSRGKISKGDIDATCAEIRQALLESDVALEVVESFIAQVAQKSTEALASRPTKLPLVDFLKNELCVPNRREYRLRTR